LRPVYLVRSAVSFGDLHHQLTGWRDDQCPRLTHIAVRRWSLLH
jgi:hypothetical protein